MRGSIVILAAVLGACGRTGGVAAPAASAGEDPCAAHVDAASCRADGAGCAWYPNTRPCQAGEPCRAGWCYRPRSPGGGTTSGAPPFTSGCACPGGAAEVCVTQAGAEGAPEIACAPVAPGCALPDRCACLPPDPYGRCVASAETRDLCVCQRGP